jgi:5-methylcytosine-specific restriction endonuclease McrA
MPEITTIGESLYWSYANLAMAHSAVESHMRSYNKVHFIIRKKLYSGLIKGTMNVGSIADDERLKMILPQACCYCGEKEKLSIDHLMPRARGGQDNSNNFVWACRYCNSSKSDMDLLEWYNLKGLFPPLMLLRRYLKIAIDICKQNEILNVQLDQAPLLPFDLKQIPHKYPQPDRLVMWVTPLISPLS